MSDPVEEEIDDDPEYWRNRPPPAPEPPARQRIVPSLLAVPLFLIALAVSIVVVTVAFTWSGAWGGLPEEAMFALAALGSGLAGPIWGRLALDWVFKRSWNGWPSFIALLAVLGVMIWQAIVHERDMEGFMWFALGGAVLLALATGWFHLIRRTKVEE